MKTSIRQAYLVQTEISETENDSEFCSEAEIEKLQKELDSVQNILTKISPSNQGKI